MTRNDKDIDFVAAHYRHGAFSVKNGWRRLGIGPLPWRWNAMKIAAAVAVLVFVSATAAILVHNHRLADSASRQTEAVETVAPSATVVRAIDFDDATLAEVVEAIQEVYGVEVDNVPADADTLRLTLHYEGNAADLLDTINDLLDTQMSVRE